MKVWLKAGVIIFYVLGYCFDSVIISLPMQYELGIVAVSANLITGLSWSNI